MAFRRLRGRLNALQSDAHDTMGDARLMLEAVEDLIEDIQDGVEFELIKTGEASLVEFFTGNGEQRLPIRVRAIIREEEE